MSFSRENYQRRRQRAWKLRTAGPNDWQSYKAIGRELGVHWISAWRYVHAEAAERGVPVPSRPRKKPRKPTSQPHVSRVERRERAQRAWELHCAGGWSQERIGRVLGVSQRQVSTYLRRCRHAP